MLKHAQAMLKHAQATIVNILLEVVVCVSHVIKVVPLLNVVNAAILNLSRFLLVGWFVGWLVSWLAAWFVGWLANCLVRLLLICFFIVSSFPQMVRSLHCNDLFSLRVGIGMGCF